jgi:hypothetical protein
MTTVVRQLCGETVYDMFKVSKMLSSWNRISGCLTDERQSKRVVHKSKRVVHKNVAHLASKQLVSLQFEDLVSPTPCTAPSFLTASLSTFIKPNVFNRKKEKMCGGGEGRKKEN